MAVVVESVMAIVEAAEMTAAMVASAEMPSVPPALVAAPTVTATVTASRARNDPCAAQTQRQQNPQAKYPLS